MKKKTLFALVLSVLFAGCQKESRKDRSSSTTDLTPKVTYSRADTAINKWKLGIRDSLSLTSRLKTNGLLDPGPTPMSAVYVIYDGAGVYDLQLSCDKNKNNFDCQYELYKNGVATVNLGSGSGWRINDYVAALGVGSYKVRFNYSSGIMKGSYEEVSFTIYAQPTVPAGMIALYRYCNPDNGLHICTSDWEELGSMSQNFEFEKVIGYMYPSSSSAPNLKPIYRYYNSSTGSHYVTDVYGNFAPLLYEKILGYVGTSSSATMTKAIDKWYCRAIDDHFNCAPPEVPQGTVYTQDSAFICGYVQ